MITLVMGQSFAWAPSSSSDDPSPTHLKRRLNLLLYVDIWSKVSIPVAECRPRLSIRSVCLRILSSDLLENQDVVERLAAASFWNRACP